MESRELFSLPIEHKQFSVERTKYDTMWFCEEFFLPNSCQFFRIFTRHKNSRLAVLIKGDGREWQRWRDREMHNFGMDEIITWIKLIIGHKFKLKKVKLNEMTWEASQNYLQLFQSHACCVSPARKRRFAQNENRPQPGHSAMSNMRCDRVLTFIIKNTKRRKLKNWFHWCSSELFSQRYQNRQFIVVVANRVTTFKNEILRDSKWKLARQRQRWSACSVVYNEVIVTTTSNSRALQPT